MVLGILVLLFIYKAQIYIQNINKYRIYLWYLVSWGRVKKKMAKKAS